MMRIVSDHIKRGIDALFFCIVALGIGMCAFSTYAAEAANGAKASTPKTEFMKPDFAYPKSVAAEAGRRYNAAMKSGDWSMALLAALQLDVSENMVNGDSVAKSLLRFDEIANSSRSPMRQLALMAEANLYADIYRSQRYIFDNRVLSAEMRGSNPLEWSAPMFLAAADSLIRCAMSEIGETCYVPIAKVSMVLSDYSDAVKAHMSVADFIAFKAISVLSTFNHSSSANVIPFFDSSRRSPSLQMQIVDEAIGRHEADADKFILSLFYAAKGELLDEYSKSDYYKQCIEQLNDTQYCAPFIISYWDNDSSGEASESNQRRRTEYQMMKEYLGRFPKGYMAGELQNRILMLAREDVSVNMPHRLLPEQPFEVEVKGANIYKFNLLVYRLPNENPESRFTYADIKGIGNPQMIVPVELTGATPDVASDSISVDGLKPGRYAIIPSRSRSSAGMLHQMNNESVSTVMVSAINAFTVKEDGADSLHLFVVSARDMTPLPGCRVSVRNNSKKSPNVSAVYTTDANGEVVVDGKSGSVKYCCEYGDSKAYGDQYVYSMARPGVRKDLHADILTDLSLYRPAQKMAFVAAIYSNLNNTLSAEPDMKLRAELHDANYQCVDTLSVVSDSYGRLAGEFTIPTDALLGRYSVRILNDDCLLGSVSFNVAEYKAPSFVVSAEADGVPVIGEDVIVSGEAVTYAGMPVIGAKVSYTVSTENYWWRRGNIPDATYGGETVTDNNGKFHISLPTAGLVDTPYAKSQYRIEISVTDQAGETVESPAVRFGFERGDRIEVSFPDRIDASTSDGVIKVAAYDARGMRKRMKLFYEISGESVGTLSGVCETPDFKLPLDAMESGEYKIKLSFDSLPGADSRVEAGNVIIYRRDDVRPPVKSALWVPQRMITASRGESRVPVRFGTSFAGSHVWVCVSDGSVILRSEWVKVDNEMKEISVDVPQGDSRVFVTLVGSHDFDMLSETVTIRPYMQSQNLKAEVKSFRDKISCGAREKWEFRFSLDSQPMANIPVMAVMSDKSLNAIAPFRWSLNPDGSRYWPDRMSVMCSSNFTVSNQASLYSGKASIKDHAFVMPQWQTYGYPLYSRGRYSSGVRMMKMAASRAQGSDSEAASMMIDTDDVVNEVVVTEAAMDYAAVKEEVAIGASDTTSFESYDDQPIRSRQAEEPVAFFMPALVTDKDGVAVVDFDVPQQPASWQFQIAGYTPEMKGAVLALDAVANRRVMVRLNPPRFVRTGDHMSVAATVFNNSDSTAMIQGSIELFDINSGEVMARNVVSQDIIKGMESYLMQVDYVVPGNVEAIGIRAVARSDSYSDGEQDIIAVLPSSSPVVESEPFYLKPGDKDYTLKLPHFDADARVTLKYCDNPVWECVSVLPSLIGPQSANALCQADALFGDAVAAGLFSRYPDLLAGVERMAADSLLVSPLQRDANLKIVALGCSPWVNSASAETLRMKSLTGYRDSAYSSQVIGKTIAALRALQNQDGGWSWCDGMESSSFVTLSLLERFAQLNRLGYLPSEMNGLVENGFRFMDGKLVESWKRSTPRSFSTAELLHYLYIKDAFANSGNYSGFEALEREALKTIAQRWKDFSVMQKAMAAVVLYHHGKSALSESILASIREFARFSAERGMWFDSDGAGYGRCNDLIQSAYVLQAYEVVAPQSPDIDLLRQNMLMMKQVQNWGDSRSTAMVIASIIGSGTDWNRQSDRVSVSVGGKTLDIGDTNLCGSFTVDLGAGDVAGTDLRIVRESECPAWGGVVSQYVAPILSVKDKSIPQLSIRKSLVKVTADSVGVKGSSRGYAMGDLVRVTLTLKCDRDIEYVVIRDERGAMLEPVDQISSYTVSDGVWYYREVRDTQTSLFIPSLRKGVHQISYDCRIDREGEYTIGVATAQSLYAPEITAHSAGTLVSVSAAK